MKQKTLLQLLPPQQEQDYVEHFQSLAQINLEINQHGATAERLLRKSILEMDLGNYSAALDAARDASDVRADFAEAHYQQGMGLLLLAFCKAGVLAGAPGMERPIGGVRTLMEHAVRAFGQALELNTDDAEVAEDIAVLSAFLAAHDDADLQEALRTLRVAE